MWGAVKATGTPWDKPVKTKNNAKIKRGRRRIERGGFLKSKKGQKYPHRDSAPADVDNGVQAMTLTGVGWGSRAYLCGANPARISEHVCIR